MFFFLMLIKRPKYRWERKKEDSHPASLWGKEMEQMPIQSCYPKCTDDHKLSQAALHPLPVFDRVVELRRIGWFRELLLERDLFDSSIFSHLSQRKPGYIIFKVVTDFEWAIKVTFIGDVRESTASMEETNEKIASQSQLLKQKIE